MCIIMMMKEIWKDIKGYEGKYQVSNLGRVKSMWRNNQYETHIGEPTIRKQWKNRLNYWYVGLTFDGKQKQYRVNRLVWETFNGPIPEGMQVNHINEDKSDNRLENLNLMTSKDNNNWGTRNKRVSQSKINRCCVKPIYQYSLDGKLLKSYPSVREASRQTGFDQGFISACARKGFKPAYGYKWSYISPEEVIRQLDALFDENKPDSDFE